MSQNRVFGLDVLRCIAITTVVYGHGLGQLPTGLDMTSSTVRLQFIDGVAIFFALSGYLIGSILFKKIATEPINGRLLLTFWRDRWLRTLPAYFFVLAVLIVGLWSVVAKIKWLPYFAFLQNMHTGEHYFPESWSLAVEEWFYLTVPVIFILSGRLGRQKKVFPSIIAGILILANLIRVVKYQRHLPDDYLDFAYRVMLTVPTRVDAIMYGVLMAYMAYYKHPIWNSKNLTFALGITGFTANHILYNHTAEIGVYTLYFYIPLQGLFSALLIPKMASIKVGRGWLARVITYVSLTSYSIYLLHGSFFMVYVKPLLPPNFFLQLLAYLVVAFGFSYILYRTVEQVGMRWRKRMQLKEKLSASHTSQSSVAAGQPTLATADR